MQPGALGYQRELGELNRLADLLFAVVRREYDPAPQLILGLDRSDRLLCAPVGEHELVAATLLCAQLLRRAAAAPEQAPPRHVVCLADFIDQLIPQLLAVRPLSARATQVLHAIQAEIDGIAMNLALLADPGAPDYEEE